MAHSYAQLEQLYRDRPLTTNYPRLTQLGVDTYHGSQTGQDAEKEAGARRLLADIGRVVPLARGARILVVGSGPHPVLMRTIEALGYEAAGVEPIPAYVEAANRYLGGDKVRLGSAERAGGHGDGTFDVVIAESVMEHVDSPLASVQEAFRLLRPGGLLYVTTTNRWRFHWRGENGEFKVPFYNYFPRLLKEAYVSQHLLYRPELAGYTPRPAVHWYSYAGLCALGRQAGFAQFFSKLDIVPVEGGGPRARVLRLVKFNPWLRALALLQLGFTIFMVRRPDPVS